MRVHAPFALLAVASAFNALQITDPFCKTGIISNDLQGPSSKTHRFACCPKMCLKSAGGCLNTDEQCEAYMAKNEKGTGGDATEACCGSRIVGYSGDDWKICKYADDNGTAEGKTIKASDSGAASDHVYRKNFCRHIKKSAKTAADRTKGGSGDTMYFPVCEHGVPPCVLDGGYHTFIKEMKEARDGKALKDKFANKEFYKDCDDKDVPGYKTHKVGSRTINASGDAKDDCAKFKGKCGGDPPKAALDHEMWNQCCAHSKGTKAGKEHVAKMKEAAR